MNEDAKEILLGLHKAIYYDNKQKMKLFMDLFDMYGIDYEELTIEINR